MNGAEPTYTIVINGVNSEADSGSGPITEALFRHLYHTIVDNNLVKEKAPKEFCEKKGGIAKSRKAMP